MEADLFSLRSPVEMSSGGGGGVSATTTEDGEGWVDWEVAEAMLCRFLTTTILCSCSTASSSAGGVRDFLQRFGSSRWRRFSSRSIPTKGGIKAQTELGQSQQGGHLV